MAQQSKITSRPLTKALGTASILSMAIAGANMANALETDFGVTYKADAFNVDGEAHGTDRSLTGFANLLRVKADFKDENTGVSVHSSIQLSGDYWTGDSRDTSQAGDPSYNDGQNETITLDTGYLQIPMGGNLVRVGRQASSYNNCFLTCDDRRDRVIGIFPTEVGVFTANWDRRADTDQTFGAQDSGDQVGASYTTKVGGFTVGALWFHWLKNSGRDADYTFQGAHGASSYINGAITDGVNIMAGFNWVGQNEQDNEEGAFGSEGDAGDGWAYYLRAEGDVGVLNWGAQYVHTIDGGLMSNGYDTYSSLISNTPDSNENPTSLLSLGRGFSTQDYDEQLLIGKLGFDITPKFNLTGAVGYLNVDNGDDDDGSMVYDLSGNYKINESVTAIATVGLVTENDVAGPAANVFGPITGMAGNSLVRPTVANASEFANEDLMAAKVGLRVSF